MTLDDIQNSIFQGKKGVSQALELVTKYVSNKKVPLNNQEQILSLYRKTKAKLETISPEFINQISVTQRYKNYVKQVVPESKIDDILVRSVKLMQVATDDSNKRILDAREPATKRNREFEKNEVIKFFRLNYSSILVLFELYNMLHDIKSEINR